MLTPLHMGATHTKPGSGQHLMVHGPAQAVADRAKELTRLFPTGLIISPSHEALLPDVPPEHVEALRKAMTGA